MKKLIKTCGSIAAIFAIGWSIQPAFADEQTPVKLKGEFVWAADKTQTKTPIQALLHPHGQNEYTVVYTFNWKGKLHNYHGIVKGSLQSGDVTGTGDADDAKRNFTFKGTAANGVITGKCFEIKGDKEVPQGTVELKN